MKEEWEYKKLGEVASYINGFAFKPSQWSDTGTPIVRIQNLNNPEASYNYYDGILPEKVKIKKGDLLISWSASLGAYLWMGDEAYLNQHIFKVQFDKLDIDKIYLKYAVSSKLDVMANLVHGATMKHIVKSDFDKTKIPYPPKSTQLSIISELDKINELIRIKKEQLKDYDALAQSIFYEMFGDPVKNEKGWEVKKIGDVCKTSSGGTPSKAHDEYYNGDILWLRSGEVGQGDIYDTEQTITLLGLENSSAKIFPVNTVVIAMYGATVGQVGILRKEMSTNQAICGILPNGVLTPEYLNYFLLNRKFEFLKSAIGGAQANISQQIIRKTLIPLPPLSLQNSFTCRIRRIKQLKIEIQKTITDMEILLASRMQYWFG